MDTMRVCPSCGKQVAAEAPQGLCPECLMKAGFGSATKPGPEPDPGFVPPTVETLAKLFPQLEILAFLGKGGMGAVYKARQPALDRFVALKILPPRAGNDPGFAERFTREARALAKLSHPNVVGVYDFGRVDGLHYFLMEYVDGLNLRQLEADGKLTPREALKIIPQICEALQFAHDEGIVHRDIKPENVLLDKKGRVKIADFGLARILGKEPTTLRLTGAKDVVGTPHYMAPEQVEHPREVDHRADIYSLGVVFYEMLTGELPLGRFAPPSRRVSVDVRLDEVVMRTLEKEPERRYQHASQVKDDVENISRAPATPPLLSSAAPSQTTPADPVQKQVKGPAIGLVVTGIANWLLLPLIIVLVLPALSRAAHVAKETGLSQMGLLPVIVLLATPFLLCAILILAALRMMRLNNYRSAIGASIVAMLVTPGNIIGFPIGIWSLSVLLRRETRQAFEARQALAGADQSRGPFRGLTVLWLLALVLLVFSIVTSPPFHRTLGWRLEAQSPQLVKAFGFGDTPLSSSVEPAAGGWMMSASNETVRLFELSSPLASAAKGASVLTYRAQMKSDDLQGRAYLEMWCRFPGEGEFFSRGFQNALTGSNNWATVETSFWTASDRHPDLVRLNLVVEGKGTILIKDVELLATKVGY